MIQYPRSMKIIWHYSKGLLEHPLLIRSCFNKLYEIRTPCNEIAVALFTWACEQDRIAELRWPCHKRQILSFCGQLTRLRRKDAINLQVEQVHVSNISMWEPYIETVAKWGGIKISWTMWFLPIYWYEFERHKKLILILSRFYTVLTSQWEENR